MTDKQDEIFNICYECARSGDEYYFNDDGELICACDTCWVRKWEE